MSSGGSPSMRVSERIATNIAAENFPCPDGFPKPCVHLDPDPGGLSLLPCSGATTTQRWNLTAARNLTAVQSEASGSCWEINGCSGPDVDTNYVRSPPCTRRCRRPQLC